MIELVPLTLFALYLIPFMVAAARDHEYTVTVLLANLAFGWTGIGWAVVMWWALRGPVETLDPPRRSLYAIPGERTPHRHLVSPKPDPEVIQRPPSLHGL